MTTDTVILSDFDYALADELMSLPKPYKFTSPEEDSLMDMIFDRTCTSGDFKHLKNAAIRNRAKLPAHLAVMMALRGWL
jgi:hypothetical protein